MASDLNKLREEKNIAQAAWDSMKAELDAVPREDVMVTSGNPKGECPAFIHGDFNTTKKGRSCGRLQQRITLAKNGL